MRNAVHILLACLILTACHQDSDSGSPTVSSVSNPGGTGSRYPFVVSGAANEAVLMSWLERGAGSMNFVWSSFDGNNWATPELIRSSDQFFVNWADFPSIAALNNMPVAAHWLQKVEGSTYAYHVHLALRSESGAWTEPVTPHVDRSASEHGFASLLPVDDKRLFAIWLDGYQTEQGSPMTLHSAIINTDGSIEQESEVDGSVCDCCQTSVARSGDSVIAVYRDRTQNEIRDVYTARFDVPSSSWSGPVPLSDEGWEIHGCPVNGPQVAANGDTVIATWFSAADDQPRNYMAVSLDGGKNFSLPQQLNKGPSVGRVGLAFNANGVALLTWVETGAEKYPIQGRVWRKQNLEEAFVIAHINGTRASGFPRAAGLGPDFLVAWTEPRTDQGQESAIKTVMVSPAIH